MLEREGAQSSSGTSEAGFSRAMDLREGVREDPLGRKLLEGAGAFARVLGNDEGIKLVESRLRLEAGETGELSAASTQPPSEPGKSAQVDEEDPARKEYNRVYEKRFVRREQVTAEEDKLLGQTAANHRDWVINEHRSHFPEEAGKPSSTPGVGVKADEGRETVVTGGGGDLGVEPQKPQEQEAKPLTAEDIKIIEDFFALSDRIEARRKDLAEKGLVSSQDPEAIKLINIGTEVIRKNPGWYEANQARLVKQSEAARGLIPKGQLEEESRFLTGLTPKQKKAFYVLQGWYPLFVSSKLLDTLEELSIFTELADDPENKDVIRWVASDYDRRKKAFKERQAALSGVGSGAEAAEPADARSQAKNEEIIDKSTEELGLSHEVETKRRELLEMIGKWESWVRFKNMTNAEIKAEVNKLRESEGFTLSAEAVLKEVRDNERFVENGRVSFRKMAEREVPGFFGKDERKIREKLVERWGFQAGRLFKGRVRPDEGYLQSMEELLTPEDFKAIKAAFIGKLAEAWKKEEGVVPPSGDEVIEYHRWLDAWAEKYPEIKNEKKAAAQPVQKPAVESGKAGHAQTETPVKRNSKEEAKREKELKRAKRVGRAKLRRRLKQDKSGLGAGVKLSLRIQAENFLLEGDFEDEGKSMDKNEWDEDVEDVLKDSREEIAKALKDALITSEDDPLFKDVKEIYTEKDFEAIMKMVFKMQEEEEK